jgi:hypothetical protein
MVAAAALAREANTVRRFDAKSLPRPGNGSKK